MGDPVSRRGSGLRYIPDRGTCLQVWTAGCLNPHENQQLSEAAHRHYALLKG